MRDEHFQIKVRNTRSIVIVAFALACGCALVFAPKIFHRAEFCRAVSELQSKGVFVYYDFQIRNDGTFNESASPSFLALLIGTPFLHDPIDIDYVRSRPPVELDNHTIRSISRLPRIQSIVVGPHASDSGLSCISQLKDLKMLSIRSSHISDLGLESLNMLQYLEDARIQSSRVDGSFMCSWSHLPNLTYVDLSGCPVNDLGCRCISVCTAIERLEVNGTHISDAGLEFLAKMANLRDLRFYGAVRFGDEKLRWLRKQLPNCEILQ